MPFKQLPIWLFVLFSIGYAYAEISNWNACSGRLERALDALHRDSTRRNKLDEEEARTMYQQELRSAPLEMSVTRMAVKVTFPLIPLFSLLEKMFLFLFILFIIKKIVEFSFRTIFKVLFLSYRLCRLFAR